MSDVLVQRYASEVTIIRGDPPTQIIQNTPVANIIIQREGIPGARGPRGFPGPGQGVEDGDYGDVIVTGAGGPDELWDVPELDNKADITGEIFTGPVEVPPEPYSAEWEGSNEVVTKADLFNKFESFSSGDVASMDAFIYDFSSVVNVPPGVHQVRLNNGTYSAATKVWVDYETNNGFDSSFAISRFEPGEQLYLQDKVDAAIGHRYNIIGAPVDYGSYAEIPIEWVEGTGVFGNKKTIVLARLKAEVPMVWGNILGDIQDQEDLQAALDAKVGEGDIFTADEAGVVPASGGGEEKFMRADGAWAVPTQPILLVQEIAFIIDAGNNPIQTGVKGDLHIPFDCEVIGWTVLGDQVGNISVDIEREVLGAFPPDTADDITGTNPPKLINQSSASGDATSWLSTIVANSVLRYRVTSADTVKRVTISLTVEKVL
jgi:hypothetical protein